MNTPLMTAVSGLTLEEARADREFWGRLTESAVGAHLSNAEGLASAIALILEDRRRDGLRGVPASARREKVTVG